ncbi:MAG: DUF1648 domain-containing protein, partial [Dehalococcoidia bacterium]|nr:DUF1648 domain-containing protein [Dehalococcoidia bacterium]
APVFRVSFIIAPVVLAGLCIIASILFYSSLQPSIAFHFNADGEARRTMGKIVFTLIMSVAQILGVLISWGTASIIIKLGKSAFKISAPQFKLDGFITLMSNMILLPQIILAYLMLDAFIFNVWQRHFTSVIHFSVAAIIIGSAIIFGAFILLISQARSAVNKQ